MGHGADVGECRTDLIAALREELTGLAPFIGGGVLDVRPEDQAVVLQERDPGDAALQHKRGRIHGSLGKFSSW
ncbi:hypothetical protein [Streptomyces shenzhenensis]|uniref:hypothetical protein n=1 Tax=Streptomyces shenzhenensis TaxID=943815 RepID=UPI0036783E99